MSPGRHNLRFVSYEADKKLTQRLLFLDWKQGFVRLPSGSGLGQSSVGLVYAMRRPLSDEPTRVRQEAQANRQLCTCISRLSITSEILEHRFVFLSSALHSCCFLPYSKYCLRCCLMILPFWLSLLHAFRIFLFLNISLSTTPPRHAITSTGTLTVVRFGPGYVYL